jgi:hypothetical protein
MTCPISLITENNYSAIRDAEQFEKNSVYTEIMCGKEVAGGAMPSTFKNDLARIIKYINPSPDDINFWVSFKQTFGKARCTLPKGHSGPCSCNLSGFFTDRFAGKIRDCHMAPPGKGTNIDILANRHYRNEGCQIDRVIAQEIVEVHCPFLKDLPKKQTNGEKKVGAFVPIENGSTGFMIASATFDMVALMTRQEGIEYKNEFHPDVLTKYEEHAEYLITHYKTVHNMTIADSSGYLCDPWSLERIKANQYKTKSNYDFGQIQFGHVFPISHERYMTRGLNVLPITRETNAAQNKRSFPEFVQRQKELAAKH